MFYVQRSTLKNRKSEIVDSIASRGYFIPRFFSIKPSFAFDNKALRRKTIFVLRLSRTEPGTLPTNCNVSRGQAAALDRFSLYEARPSSRTEWK